MCALVQRAAGAAGGRWQTAPAGARAVVRVPGELGPRGLVASWLFSLAPPTVNVRARAILESNAFPPHAGRHARVLAEWQASLELRPADPRSGRAAAPPRLRDPGLAPYLELIDMVKEPIRALNETLTQRGRAGERGRGRGGEGEGWRGRERERETPSIPLFPFDTVPLSVRLRPSPLCPDAHPSFLSTSVPPSVRPSLSLSPSSSDGHRVA